MVTKIGIPLGKCVSSKSITWKKLFTMTPSNAQALRWNHAARFFTQSSGLHRYAAYKICKFVLGTLYDLK